MNNPEALLRQRILEDGIRQSVEARFTHPNIDWERMHNGMLTELKSWPATPSKKGGYGNFPWGDILARYAKSSRVYAYAVTYQGVIQMAAMLKVSRRLDRVTLRFVERNTNSDPMFVKAAAPAAIEACVAVATSAKSVMAKMSGQSFTVQVGVHSPASGLKQMYMDLGHPLPGNKYMFKNEKFLLLGIV